MNKTHACILTTIFLRVLYSCFFFLFFFIFLIACARFEHFSDQIQHRIEKHSYFHDSIYIHIYIYYRNNKWILINKIPFLFLSFFLFLFLKIFYLQRWNNSLKVLSTLQVEPRDYYCTLHSYAWCGNHDIDYIDKISYSNLFHGIRTEEKL